MNNYIANSANNQQNIYHERQIKELCALHSLNNLLQDPTAFTKASDFEMLNLFKLEIILLLATSNIN